MKLEKFKKNTKQKKVLIGISIGLILLVGGITLYRTFALYEEKKEFNVLRGRVPNFSRNDIKLAFTINGEQVNGTKFPNKEDGYTVNSVVCKNGVTADWNYSLWGLVNIKNTTNEKIECNINFINGTPLLGNVEIGDYIAYTPEKTSYEIANELTNCANTTKCGNINLNGVQTVYPNELTLWRVIKVNNDNTIEIVSEYTTSKSIYLSGRNSYTKYIQILNTIAKQYETEGITIGSRHVGYNGQTEVVTLKTGAPWSTNTTSTNSPNGSDREKAGGGDYGYIIDYNLIENAKGSTIAYLPNTTTAASYWLASRVYYYVSSTSYTYAARYIDTNGSTKDFNMECAADSYDDYHWHNIRPIVTLRSDLTANEGTLNGKKLWTIN